MKNGSPKPVRCAIYTRVSTDQGLDQDSIHWTPSVTHHKPIFEVRPTPVGPKSERDMTMAIIPAATPIGRL